MVPADLTWGNICRMRRPRGPSWHQSWVWWGASLGCSNADSAGCGWIQDLSAWTPSWPCSGSPSLKNCVTMWITQTGLEVANHDEKLSLLEKKVNQLIRNAGSGETLGFFHLTHYGWGKCQGHSSGSCRLRRCFWISSELWTIKTTKLVPKWIFLN